jgi:hypothetical protein
MLNSPPLIQIMPTGAAVAAFAADAGVTVALVEPGAGDGWPAPEISIAARPDAAQHDAGASTRDTSFAGSATDRTVVASSKMAHGFIGPTDYHDCDG